VTFFPSMRIVTGRNIPRDKQDMSVNDVITHTVNPLITSQIKLLFLQGFEVIKKDGFGALIQK
jgi:hypothetical protein